MTNCFPYGNDGIEYSQNYNISKKRKSHLQQHFVSNFILSKSSNCPYLYQNNKTIQLLGLSNIKWINVMQLRNIFYQREVYFIGIQTCSNQSKHALYRFIRFNIISSDNKSQQVMECRRPEGALNLPPTSISQRTTPRFSTLASETYKPLTFSSQNSSPTTESFRQRLPKFKTQQNSPLNIRKGSMQKFRFPQLVGQEISPSKYGLHNVNMDQIRSGKAKTSFILDSIIKILKEGEDLPKFGKKEKIQSHQIQEFNQFLDLGKERRAKRPKIINNEMTRIFMSSQEKERKYKGNSCLIKNVISQKIGKIHSKNAEYQKCKMLNEFLPEVKEELNNMRTFRFGKK